MCVRVCERVFFFLFVRGGRGFFCATTKLCQFTAPNRYCPSALNGITSKLSYCIELVAL